MLIRPEMLAPNGSLHAAAIIALADTAAGYATRAHLPDGAASFTTIELKTNFSAPRPRACCCARPPPCMAAATPRCGTPK
jgi:acyl-coenzyme A thioesterase PaaI-like protein